jgi:hypothetical protein
MPSDLQRVAQALVECLDQIPNMVGYLQRLAVRCRENASLVADSAGNQAARTAALQLDAAARACEEAAHLAAMAPPAARAWAEQMVSGARTVDRTSMDTSRRDAASGERPADGDRTPTRPPLDIAEILNRLPKQEMFGRRMGKTRGIWTDVQGDEYDLASGEDEYQRRAAAWVKQLRLGPPPHSLLIDSHVEVKFAMMMRERGLRDETIVINNPPCGGDWGCDKALEDFLPPGANLKVVAPGFSKTYRGKGRPA